MRILAAGRNKECSFIFKVLKLQKFSNRIKQKLYFFKFIFNNSIANIIINCNLDDIPNEIINKLIIIVFQNVVIFNK